MHTPWIDSWFSAREKLENLGKNWIEYQTFKNICEKEKVDKDDIDRLDRYLHDLGVIIHFRHNVKLQNMVILKPEWATKAVYKILDTPSVREREGVLLHSELDQIWDTKTYPQSIYPNLLELMNEFELAYELPDKKSHLIAELLNPSEPDFPWNNKDNLVFYYNYEFLPASVMPRFIVLIHDYLESTNDGKHLCWREGAVLKWNGAHAFVKVKMIEKLVEIRIQGRNKRELLAVIREKFEYINKSIKKVEIKQEIPCCCSPRCPNKFNYQDLLEAEVKGETIIKCQKRWIDVPLLSLLDGYQLKRDRLKNIKYQRFSFKNVETLIINPKNINQRKRITFMDQKKITNVKNSIIYGSFIENSFNTLRESFINEDLKNLLNQLLETIDEINSKIPPDKIEDAKNLAQDAETFVKEVTKPNPRREWYNISLKGLIDAATKIGKLAFPVLTIVEKIKILLR